MYKGKGGASVGGGGCAEKTAGFIEGRGSRAPTKKGRRRVLRAHDIHIPLRRPGTGGDK